MGESGFRAGSGLVIIGCLPDTSFAVAGCESLSLYCVCMFLLGLKP